MAPFFVSRQARVLLLPWFDLLCSFYNAMESRSASLVFSLFLALLPILALPQLAHQSGSLKSSPGLTVREAGGWKLLQKGIEYRKIALERSEPSYSLELKLIRFDPQSVIPRVVPASQYRLKGADVKTLAEKSRAIAAINANYFDENGKALGFLKAAAAEINRSVSKSSLFTGIFGIRNLSPFILHRDDFHSAQADEALQSGPLLLSQGRALEVGRGRTSRRALIGIDKEKRLIIGITAVLFGGLNWAELQEIFSVTQWGLETADLLNLDGGGSAQLYIKTARFQDLTPGTSEVPVAIGFFMK